ncbi:hypothetical protein [Aliagarivorans taiwanensis]|uniref:hypothetical protein n=1 Tax=Aliagarivorans taiwanensis TaxID=561966 RepID=UPI0003F8807B|nr:hypothetical protein [Aliagarivorans taiwanensis]
MYRGSLSELLSESWRFYLRHLKAIACIILPIALPFIALQNGFLGEDGKLSQDNYLLLTLVGIGLEPIYIAAVVLYIRAQLLGEPWSVGTCLRAGLKVWPQLTLVVAFTLAMTLLGLGFFILPGLVIASRLMFASLNCTLLRLPAWRAIQLSWKQTAPYAGMLLKAVIVMMALVMLPFWLIHQHLLTSQAASIWFYLNRAAGTLLEVYPLVFAYRCYSAMVEEAA